ncbi:hypothetical protein DFJ66_4826 [Saccharothrix variisporea]|uniref:Uncharacterized protein n=1 Tax=Saccharothrix variisporea TaxID=543527 RepID=A0A495XFY2_9PSEU|nr:hypothetical protein DFJ66_4826 [Saccharothrix variisporea]
MDSVDNARSRCSSPGWRCGRTRVVTRGQIAAPGENYGGGPFGPQMSRVVPSAIPGCGSSSPRVLHRVIVARISPDRCFWRPCGQFVARGSPAEPRAHPPLAAPTTPPRSPPPDHLTSPHPPLGTPPPAPGAPTAPPPGPPTPPPGTRARRDRHPTPADTAPGANDRPPDLAATGRRGHRTARRVGDRAAGGGYLAARVARKAGRVGGGARGGREGAGRQAGRQAGGRAGGQAGGQAESERGQAGAASADRWKASAGRGRAGRRRQAGPARAGRGQAGAGRRGVGGSVRPGGAWAAAPGVRVAACGVWGGAAGGGTGRIVVPLWDNGDRGPEAAGGRGRARSAARHAGEMRPAGVRASVCGSQPGDGCRKAERGAVCPAPAEVTVRGCGAPAA